jgi:hypothetical protein
MALIITQGRKRVKTKCGRPAAFPEFTRAAVRTGLLYYYIDTYLYI